MAEFNAMDTAAFKGVWVFCEQREGQVQAISYQLLSEGRKLANDLGVELCGVVMGSEVNEDYLKALGGYGADRVYYIDSPLLKDYTTDGYAKVLCDLIMEKKPEIMLIGATNLGRDLGPRCAARLHTGLTADCTHLDVDVAKYKDFLRTTSTIDVDNTKFEENTNLKMTRPAFGGHLMATIICPRFRPQMSTVRPGVMQTQPFDEAGAAKVVVEKVTPALTADDIHVEILDIKKSAKKLVDLIGADVVVSVGRGISSDPEKGIALAEELAGALGGVVGVHALAVELGIAAAVLIEIGVQQIPVRCHEGGVAVGNGQVLCSGLQVFHGLHVVAQFFQGARNQQGLEGLFGKRALEGLHAHALAGQVLRMGGSCQAEGQQAGSDGGLGAVGEKWLIGHGCGLLE